jgi:hypothetical protein
VVTSDAYIDDFRRYDLPGGDPLRLRTHCEGHYSSVNRDFRDVGCTSPVGTGKLTLSGDVHRLAPPAAYELTFAGSLTIPLGRDLQNQRPDAVCELPQGSVSTNLIVNREKPPFDNPDLRRAMALSLDRKTFVDILTEGQGAIGGAMLPPPEGVWAFASAALRIGGAPFGHNPNPELIA